MFKSNFFSFKGDDHFFKINSFYVQIEVLLCPYKGDNLFFLKISQIKYEKYLRGHTTYQSQQQLLHPWSTSEVVNLRTFA